MERSDTEHQEPLVLPEPEQQPMSPQPARSVKPEPRGDWGPYLMVGLVLWPLLVLAAVKYVDGRRAYLVALAQYRAGREPEWYWDGLPRDPDTEDSSDYATRRITSVILGVLLGAAMLMLVVMTVLNVLARQ